MLNLCKYFGNYFGFQSFRFIFALEFKIVMKDKIIQKATQMFLKLGFKSVTMDDIACEMCISKKTIYKYFSNKEILIEEGTQKMQLEIKSKLKEIIEKNHNAIEENFVIRSMFNEMFKASETSPVYQLKKHYPTTFEQIRQNQIDICREMFQNNIEKGIEQNLYRKEIKIQHYVKFYYELIFIINENTELEREIESLELEALEYHIRAMANENGIAELEKQLLIYTS